MLRKGSLVLLIGCFATFGLVGCSDDDSTTCGDGVAEGSEDCDLTDLGGMTCADVVAGSQGTLRCSDQCRYDTTNCAACGDGVRAPFGEACDCGTDVNNLPANCTDVNGGADANCSTTCTKLAYCGDGIPDNGEDCDCGIDINDLPTGCLDVNGGNNATCDTDCQDIIECNQDQAWEVCDPLVPNDCCGDAAGVQMECVESLYADMDNMCNRTCTDAADCWFNTLCLPSYNQCLIQFCGPGELIDVPFFAGCQAQGGTAGVCVPFGRYSDTHTAFGLCIETGDIAHGGDCPADADLFGTDRDADGGAAAKMCDEGLCYAATGATTGTCFQACDWQSAYAVAFYGAAANTDPMPCPTDSNCFAESTIDETTGYRGGDWAACRVTEEADPDGMTACSLVTGTLLNAPTQSCADAGFTNGRCVMVQFSSGEVTNGSLIGVCSDGTAAVNKAVWDACDDSTNSTDVCPAGSVCVNQDIFGADSGPTRCVPYCDTENPAGDQPHCAALGAVPTGDGTPTCQSQSELYAPGGPLDESPTRLGLCGI